MGSGRPGSEELKGLIRTKDNVKVLKAKNRKLVELLHDLLGWGESEAIAIALEHNCIVRLDNRIARSKARSLGLNIIGTLGILRRAHDSNLINKNQLIDNIEKLKEIGFSISDTIVRELIKKLQ